MKEVTESNRMKNWLCASPCNVPHHVPDLHTQNVHMRVHLFIRLSCIAFIIPGFVPHPLSCLGGLVVRALVM